MTDREAPVDSRIVRFRRDHSFLWGASLVVLGLAMLYASVGVGATVANQGRSPSGCWTSEDFGGPVTPTTCRAHGGTVAYRGGHTGLGVLLGVLGGLTLTWLVPLLVARHFGGPVEKARRAEDARPKHGQPYPLQERAQVIWDGEGACWWTGYDGWWWRLDRGTPAWRRGDPLPARWLTGSTREATWARAEHELLHRQNRLIEEQNRLLAGAPVPEIPAVFANVVATCTL